MESYSTAITTSLHDSKGSYQLSLLHEATRQERQHCPKQLRRRSRHRFTTVRAAVECHDLHLLASTKSGWGRVYWSHTKRTALFCCRTWPRPPWAHKPPDGLLAAHERNGAVLLQNAAPTPLSTHEHSRVRFSILTPGQGPQP